MKVLWLPGLVMSLLLVACSGFNTPPPTTRPVTYAEAFGVFDDDFGGVVRYSRPTYFQLWDLQEMHQISVEHGVWCGEYQVNVRAYSDVPWELAPGTYGRCYVVWWFDPEASEPAVTGVPNWLESQLEAEGKIPDFVSNVPPLPDF